MIDYEYVAPALDRSAGRLLWLYCCGSADNRVGFLTGYYLDLIAEWYGESE